MKLEGADSCYKKIYFYCLFLCFLGLYDAPCTLLHVGFYQIESFMKLMLLGSQCSLARLTLLQYKYTSLPRWKLESSRQVYIIIKNCSRLHILSTHKCSKISLLKSKAGNWFLSKGFWSKRLLWLVFMIAKKLFFQQVCKKGFLPSLTASSRFEKLFWTKILTKVWIKNINFCGNEINILT